MIALVYVLYDNSYRSNSLFSNTPTYASGLKVRLKFYIKVSNSSYIPDYLMDLIIGMMIDRGPKFFSAMSPTCLWP